MVMRKWVDNIPLKQKILAIILIGISITTTMSFLIIQILSSVYNRLLYHTMSESMAYSAQEIVEYMANMVNLTEMFLSDEKVQRDLTILKEEYERKNVSPESLNNVNISVGNYYQNFSDGILKYICLYTPISVLKTNLIAADKVPREVQRKILFESEQKDGAPCWITGYMEEYGLILARDIRRIEALKLDTLGTILLNIDMDELVKSATGFQGQYDETAYVILSKDTVLYHTENLGTAQLKELALSGIEQYGIQKTGGTSFFISHGIIKPYDWDYYCLVSYEKIERQIIGIRNFCLWITALDVLAVIIMAARMTGHLTAHIGNLRDRMQRFGQDNTRVPETEYDYSMRGDEIGALNRQFDEMSETIIRLIQENYVNELLKKEAQLRALENQINPHFLYNTLDSIKWRATAIGEGNISNMVDALGTLLRTSLNTRDEKDYTVGREMATISSYIVIQQLRYESRLHFVNEIGEEWYPYMIPKLALQPLVENAIFYGLEVSVEECDILLSVKKERERLHFYVRNTGSEMEDDLLKKLESEDILPHGNGVGLLNIDRRVKIQYGEDYGMRLYNEEDYAVAELIIPARRRGKNAEADDCR